MAPSSIVGLPSPRTPSEPPTPPPRDDASDLLSASVFSSHWYGEDRKPLRVKGVDEERDEGRLAPARARAADVGAVAVELEEVARGVL